MIDPDLDDLLRELDIQEWEYDIIPSASRAPAERLRNIIAQADERSAQAEAELAACQAELVLMRKELAKMRRLQKNLAKLIGVHYNELFTPNRKETE